MAIKKLIHITTILTIVAFTITKNTKCQNLSYFNTKENDTTEKGNFQSVFTSFLYESVITNQSSYCAITLPNNKIENRNDCCNYKVISKLKNWWTKEKVNCGETRLEKRNRREIETIEYMIRIFANLEKLFNIATDISVDLYKTGSISSECKNYAFVLINYKLTNMKYILNNWAIAIKSCLGFMNNMNNSIFCALCDESSNNYFDLNSGKLNLTKKTCDLFISNCFNSIEYNYLHIYKALSMIADMSKCTKLGQIDTEKHDYKAPSMPNLKTFENCLNGDDCTEICQHGMRINKPGALAFIDVDYLRGVWWNMAKILEIERNIDSDAIKFEDIKKQQSDQSSAGKNTTSTSSAQKSSTSSQSSRRLNLSKKTASSKRVLDTLKCIFF